MADQLPDVPSHKPGSVPGLKPNDDRDNGVLKSYLYHSTGLRVNTDSYIHTALKQRYPDLDVTTTQLVNCNLLGYAAAGHATCTELGTADPNLPSGLKWTTYRAPARRLDGAVGTLAQDVLFARYLYKWQGHDFLLYVVDGRDGTMNYPSVRNGYLLAPAGGPGTAAARGLVLACGAWTVELHDEIWVYDRGYWQKSQDLYQSVMKASWDVVILDEDMKQSLIDDHLTFFKSRSTYDDLKVPWKRGIIYYGPPGNGKTISIKATMNMLYKLKDPVPTLYVRSFDSYGGPSMAVMQIFQLARSRAPCYLVFEDLDSLINEQVRSYFLNEVDGLKSNDGIFIIGSTNHLDRLDPGIAKRPSRFDRKYFFSDPNRDQRIAYARFWQRKLANNDDLDFPDEMCGAVADLTDDFSFAYMQEAFVAALLAIARRDKAKESTTQDENDELTEDVEGDWVGVLSPATAMIPRSGGGGDLDKLVLWVELKRQIKILREGMEEKQRALATGAH